MSESADFQFNKWHIKYCYTTVVQSIIRMLREKWLYKRKINIHRGVQNWHFASINENAFNKHQMQCHSHSIREIQVSAWLKKHNPNRTQAYDCHMPIKNKCRDESPSERQPSKQTALPLVQLCWHWYHKLRCLSWNIFQHLIKILLFMWHDRASQTCITNTCPKIL